VNPPLYPLVRVTDDDFEHPETGGRRRFVIVGARRGSRLHQVTAGGDYRFYRRAGYQNRPMDRDEVRLRLAAEAAVEAEINRLVDAEAARMVRSSRAGRMLPSSPCLQCPTASLWNRLWATRCDSLRCTCVGNHHVTRQPESRSLAQVSPQAERSSPRATGRVASIMIRCQMSRSRFACAGTV
jgi:hypothetical protein